MTLFAPTRIGVARFLVACAVVIVSSAHAAAKTSYNRDIRPILSENCYQCHGPDRNHRKAGLRLDVQEDAFKKLESGNTAIVAGDLEKSALIHRIHTTDEDDHMPPAKSGKKLKPEQIALLEEWIKDGAHWEGHWAYQKVERPAVPEVQKKDWTRNDIDKFILARLEKEGLNPSSEADKVTLARRLFFDLVGLPPTIDEVDAFLADNSKDSYEKLVDRLLASPQFGERMAQHWLDLARYADTNGYHIDTHRDMYKWREWVIDAFNKNEPFDKMTMEQLAGDMLPDATMEQRIASGFNRNGMVNFEGGADPDEYQTMYVIDRVTTTANVFLGSTLGCAQCHDHKYDPFTNNDFYRFYAFFNTIPEQGLDGNSDDPKPFVRVPTEAQGAKLVELLAKIPEAEGVVRQRSDELKKAQEKWETEVAAKTNDFPEVPGILAHYPFDGSIEPAADGRSQKTSAYKGTTNAPAFAEGRLGKSLRLEGNGTFVDGGNTGDFERNEAFSVGAWVKYEDKGGVIVSKMDDTSNGHFQGWDFGLADNKVWVHIVSKWETNALKVITKDAIPANSWQHILATYDGSSKAAGVKMFLNGKPLALVTERDALTASINTSAPFVIGRRQNGNAFKGWIDDVRLYTRSITEAEAAQLTMRPIFLMAQLGRDKQSDDQKKQLAEYYRANFGDALKSAEQSLAKLKESKDQLYKEMPQSMVMEEMANPRQTHMLVRGNWRDKGEVVTAGIPSIFGKHDNVTNRLELAKWFVSPEQPLTARVAVNRYWQMFFGTGLVKSANDFGSQGEWPSHPELLDWLAADFMSDWNVKRSLKQMVMSATYRQSAKVTPELLERDAYNRLLARGPRFRLDAEMIRDNALKVSGLLNAKIGGKSVYPYQPPGLWEAIGFGDSFSSQSYHQSHGDDLYRRGLYVYWKRSLPYPSLATFDAPNREVCVAQRPRTSTPLQSLVLMNDPQYVEAARNLGQHVLKHTGDLREKLVFAFRTVLSRTPSDAELSLLDKVYNEQYLNYQKNIQAAKDLITVGESTVPKDTNESELAAWTALANVLLNLDETITKG